MLILYVGLPVVLVCRYYIPDYTMYEYNAKFVAPHQNTNTRESSLTFVEKIIIISFCFT